ncbi:MAG TPA: hypothetical protein VKA26_08360 [Ignavibacteriaceae bacterium]|nr:hypothetical protein [Ignavibacteriaceae bacterium]
MKKGSKSNILSTIFVLVVFALLGLGYVSVKLKCEALVKEKYLLGEKLKAISNLNTELNGKAQDLSSEERIVKISQDELGMIKGSTPVRKLSVSKDKIEEVQKVLKEKYE